MGRKSLTHEEFKSKLTKVKPNIILLGKFKNTRTKIHAKCVDCNYEWFPTANTLINTPHGCPNCAGVTRITIDDLIKVFNKHNLKLIDNIKIKNFNSKLNMNVRCRKCNYEFSTTYNRVNYQNSSCPVCKNKKVLKGYNDIWTTNSEIAKLLSNKDDGFKYTYASNKKLDWECPMCGNIINKSVSDVYYRGLHCQNCSDGLSYPEKFIRNLLMATNIRFDYQKIFEWAKDKKYDFYLPDFNCIIETHGNQHYEENKYFNSRTLSEEQENDLYKENKAIEHGIKNYIVLDCRKSECEWIKESILKSKLLTLCNINQNTINWDKINLKSNNSLIYEVCELYKNGVSKEEIVEKLKISDSTYSRYLNVGSKNNLCNYDGKKQRIKANSFPKNNKPILCITTNKSFDSIKYAAKYYGINPSSLSLYFKRNSTYCGIDKTTNQKLQWKLL